MTQRDHSREIATMGAVFAGRTTLSEAEITSQASSAGLATSADFVAAGMCEEDAGRAARGLLEGLYMSFEDACASITAFDVHRRNLTCTPGRIAEVAHRVSERAEDLSVGREVREAAANPPGLKRLREELGGAR
jgi:hypothetical protein